MGAARYVAAFTGRFNAELILLYVMDLPHYNDALTDASPARKREQVDSFLAKELEYFQVERVMARGDPASNILSFATTRQCDLIVMPTHGLGGFRRFLLGSVTAKVLHDADCPVCTGAHLEQAPPIEKIEFRKFVCGINTEPHARKVLEFAVELAAEYRGSLTVAHATHGAEAANKARHQIEGMMPSIGTGAAYDIVIEQGEVAHAVAEIAARREADLLVIGRSPSPGVLGRLRTHAYPIIRQSPCPVISV